jgi:hypothetical protein
MLSFGLQCFLIVLGVECMTKSFTLFVAGSVHVLADQQLLQPCTGELHVLVIRFRFLNMCGHLFFLLLSEVVKYCYCELLGTVVLSQYQVPPVPNTQLFS